MILKNKLLKIIKKSHYYGNVVLNKDMIYFNKVFIIWMIIELILIFWVLRVKLPN
jgi:hypothetical protein